MGCKNIRHEDQGKTNLIHVTANLMASIYKADFKFLKIDKLKYSLELCLRLLC